MAGKRVYDPGYIFPAIPGRWASEEKQFALGLRGLFDKLFARKAVPEECFPVGSIVLTAEEQAPFAFGTWEAVSTGIQGVYGWKRTQ
jgi:hypothetical protein